SSCSRARTAASSLAHAPTGRFPHRPGVGGGGNLPSYSDALDPGVGPPEARTGCERFERTRTGSRRGERMPARSRSTTVRIGGEDPDIREVLEEMIDAGGHPVVTATNGAEGLAALAQVDPPALVLLDLMMPVMSGFAFLEELARKKDRAGDKVLLISANETVHPAAPPP